MNEILWFFGGMAALFVVASTVWLILWSRAFKRDWNRMENDLNDADEKP